MRSAICACRVSHVVHTLLIRVAHLQRKSTSTYMLVDQHNRNILSLPSELVEGFLDSRLLGFGVDDEVVLLRVWGFGDVLYMMSVSPKPSCYATAFHLHPRLPTRCRSLSPASSVSKRRSFLEDNRVREPRLRSPPGTVGPCMLIEATP